MENNFQKQGVEYFRICESTQLLSSVFDKVEIPNLENKRA
jgi:hypothetical protein